MLWCITTFFNPAGYETPVRNYHTFAANLRRQGGQLLTVELAFGDDPFRIEGDNVIRLRGESVMWQKERLINHALAHLPAECDAFAWLDADLLFGDDSWLGQARRLLDRYDVIQMFQRIFHLPKGDESYQRRQILTYPGIIYQRSLSYDWLQRRERRELPFAAPGFAWAARREAVPCLYSKDVVGSGDCVFVDSLLDCWGLHGHHHKYNDRTKEDILVWRGRLRPGLRVHYLPVDIFHLWHGHLRNRHYMHRHRALLDNDYDPVLDVTMRGAVYEWASDKPQMHAAVRDYFDARREDSED